MYTLLGVSTLRNATHVLKESMACSETGPMLLHCTQARQKHSLKCIAYHTPTL